MVNILSFVSSQSPSCKARGAASSGRSPTGGRGEEKTHPSVRPSPFFNTSVQHACYSSINVMLEMPFTVVLIVSSSVQSIPNAVRAKGQSSPPNSFTYVTIHVVLCPTSRQILATPLTCSTRFQQTRSVARSVCGGGAAKLLVSSVVQTEDQDAEAAVAAGRGRGLGVWPPTNGDARSPTCCRPSRDLRPTTRLVESVAVMKSIQSCHQ